MPSFPCEGACQTVALAVNEDGVAVMPGSLVFLLRRILPVPDPLPLLPLSAATEQRQLERELEFARQTMFFLNRIELLSAGQSLQR